MKDPKLPEQLLQFERKPVEIDPKTEDLAFQALEWKDYNEPSSDSDVDSDSDTEPLKKYYIRVFGVTNKGHSVCLTVRQFPVYFYLKVPNYFQKSEMRKVLDFITWKLRPEFKRNLLRKHCKLEHEWVDFYGFRNYEKMKTIRLVFDNSQAMAQASNMFNYKIAIKTISSFKKKYQTYESNVDPMIRFIHNRELQTSGWIHLKAGDYEFNDTATTQIDVTAHYLDVHHAKGDLGTAPFIQASFDIEVYSQYITRGKVSAVGTKVTSHKTVGIDNNFQDQFAVGFRIKLGKETRTVVSIDSDKVVTVDKPFDKEYSEIIAVINEDGVIPRDSGITDKRMFPKSEVSSNYITQIGTAFKKYGSNDFFLKHIVCLRDCAKIPEKTNGSDCLTIVESFETEAEVLLAWKRLITRLDPDIIYTYNGDLFDCDYLVTRSRMLQIEDQFMEMGRLLHVSAEIKSQTFSSGAYGTRHYQRLVIPGRINFDLLIYIGREKKLDSYKLDDVAKEFLSDTLFINKSICTTGINFDKQIDKKGALKNWKKIEKAFKILKEQFPDQEIMVNEHFIKVSEPVYQFLLKQTVFNAGTGILVECSETHLPSFGRGQKQKKHDVSPAEIFGYWQSGDPEKIKVIAEYCIQDTVLPQNLVDKMDVLPIQIEMSNVTFVPIRYLLERGQQIKVFSQIVKQTKSKGYLIPHFKTPFWNKFQVYTNGTVVTFRPKLNDDMEEFEQSLFKAKCPSQNEMPLTPEGHRFILNKKYWDIYEQEKFQGATVLDPIVNAYFDPITVLDFASLYPSIMIANQLCYSSFVLEKEVEKYGNIPGIDYKTVEWTETKNGKTKHHKYLYAQNTNSVLPELLTDLLANRRRVKKMMGAEKDPFKKSILNGRQLALKVSCNSVYGFLAAQMIQCKPIAATVTTIGRQMIQATKDFCENDFKQHAITTGLAPKNLDVKVVYGDTDSVFIKFQTDKKGIEANRESFELGKVCGEMATKALFKPPNDLEFEKVYNPCILLQRKRYIALLHEKSPEKPDYIDCKGVELKRRDNAPIVKEIYQGAVDLVMYKGKEGVDEAVQLVEKSIKELLDGKVPIEQLTISKSLRDKYKIRKKTNDPDVQHHKIKGFLISDPDNESDSDSETETKLPNLPHVILANKIRKRDPANAPVSGDRIPFVFVEDTVNPTKPKSKVSERCEDPNFVKENGLKLDILYYLNQQLRNPLVQFFELLVPEPKKMFDKLEAEYIKKRTGQKDIRSFFKPKKI